jgi:hypothetical protein
LDKTHHGQAMQCWKDAKDVILHEQSKNHVNAELKKTHADWLDVAVGNMGTIRVMSYAEMVLNENGDTKKYFEYQSKYMKDNNEEKSPDGRKMLDLDEINEEIIRVSNKLDELRNLRDELSLDAIQGYFPK